MRVVVALEDRFLQVGNRFYSHNFGYESYWKAYNGIFDSVVAVARVIPSQAAPEGWSIVNRKNVEVAPLAQYHGLYQYLRQMLNIKKSIRGTLRPGDAVILRLGGMIGTQVWKQLKPRYPYGLEVIGDPGEMFAPGKFKSPARHFFRWFFTRNLKTQCRRATAVSYVTEHTLQKRYPPNKDAYTTHYSSVDLDARDIIQDPSERMARISSLKNRLAGDGPPILLGFIGSFSQPHKLPDIHLKALAKCVDKGSNVTLEMIGEGKFLKDMRALARKLGLDARVKFRGLLPGGRPILDALDTFDLLLNATASEGLPRVVIEAMARGCPCIASDVGGTAELLEKSYLVPSGDPDMLCEKILSILRNSESMTKAARRNIRVARNYCKDILVPRRQAFYATLRERTEKYLSEEYKSGYVYAWPSRRK